MDTISFLFWGNPKLWKELFLCSFDAVIVTKSLHNSYLNKPSVISTIVTPTEQAQKGAEQVYAFYIIIHDYI